MTKEAELIETIFAETELYEIDLRNANITGTDLSKAKVEEVLGL